MESGSKKLITVILDASAAFIFVLDAQGRIVRVNRACDRLTGQAFEEIEDQLLWGFLKTSLEVEKLKRFFQTFVDPAGRSKVQPLQTIDIALQDQEGLCWIQWAATPSYHENGSLEYLVLTGIDMTPRKQTEQLLVENEKQLQAILDHSPVAIWLKDLEGRYLKVNRQFETRVGRYAKEILGKTDGQLFPSQWAEHFHVVDQHVFQEDQAVEFDDMAPDDVHIEHVYNFLLKTPEGRAYALCGMATDITERKQAEMELHDLSQLLEKQQQDLRSLATQLLTAQEEERRRIARELHDDINQRMALVSMKLSLAQNGLLDSHPVFPMLQELYESIGNVSNDICRLAHEYHPSILNDLGLGSAIDSMCYDFEKLGRLSITCEVPEEKIQQCSQKVATCLYRVAQECFRNVTKHAEASGVHLVLKEDPQKITLTIRDNGRGFNIQENLLQGLGFVSMKERVQLVGGTFSVESQLGQGTTVKVSIPKTEL